MGPLPQLASAVYEGLTAPLSAKDRRSMTRPQRNWWRRDVVKEAKVRVWTSLVHSKARTSNLTSTLSLAPHSPRS